MSGVDAPPFDGHPAWRRAAVLEDGTRVTLRPIVADDREELRRAFRKTSPKTRYLRFLGVVGDLSDAMLDYLTNVDQKDHVAIVATVTSDDLKEERGIGVARFIRVAGERDVAEAAVTVTDEMQRKGVGTLLVRELGRAAVAHGVRRLRADVLADNATMRAILESAGAQCNARAGEAAGTVAYEVELEADAQRSVPHLLTILRGAAETLAMTIKRILPESLPVETPRGDAGTSPAVASARTTAPQQNGPEGGERER
jgi:RimJ/RimL family protein N-acetyltransferase